MDPFVYRAPTPETSPKHAAINEAYAACCATVSQLLGVDWWQGDHAGLHDAAAAYASINDACRVFYTAIREHAPAGEDRTAAERCVRLSRMAANEFIGAPAADLARQALDNLRAAKWQANAAIALGGSDA
jgi:hypothetical protein